MVFATETSVVKDGDSAKLHVAPLPANPAVLAPGPCLFFKVIKDIPSKGTMVMIGNGQLGKQPVGEYPTLPETSGFKSGSSNDTDSGNQKNNSDDSSAASLLSANMSGIFAALLAITFVLGQ